MAQENGLDLDAVGSGLAREQSPPPGSHVASGSPVTVKFGGSAVTKLGRHPEASVPIRHAAAFELRSG